MCNRGLDGHWGGGGGVTSEATIPSGLPECQLGIFFGGTLIR